MDISANVASVDEIQPWRELYRQEMDCQIVHDSIHTRPGWTVEYLLRLGDTVAGYGSLAIAGPWKEKPAIYEFYVLPEHRARVFDLFRALLTASGAVMIETQTNGTMLAHMLHAFARNPESEKVLFHDKLTTALAVPGAVFRRMAPGDSAKLFAHQLEPEGDWVVECAGTIAATGGILFHYNRPYGDLFMEVAEPFRRRGLGSYLVQELKRVCYELGSVPAARCSPANIASIRTLQKAGFVPCGHVLHGTVSLH